MSTPRTLTGLWGEYAVVLALQSAGYDVEWEGGLTHGRDLTAERRERRVWVQVKTSTVPDGRISWSGPGGRARAWADHVTAVGAEPWFALVHFPTPAEVFLQPESRSLTVAMPHDVLVTAVRARQFADDVDAAREEYGRRIRQRPGRNGEQVGARLTPDGLRYPVLASDYPVLPRVM